MARTRIENGVEIPLTPEEETARDAEEKAWADEQVELKKTQYQRDRKPLYGTWEEQLDMMYHGTWKDHIAKVKADIPKGNS
jgi:hypothetical protein